MSKLFVWRNPISVSYGGTCLYVVAEDEAQARQVAERALVSKYGYDPQDVPGKDVPRFDKKLGKPDRVCDAPYGEIYYWSE
jgi:hypothetical protein